LPRSGVAGAAELGAFGRFCLGLELDDGLGAMRLETFQRRMLRDYFNGVRETLILLSKKNGKTTLLGALALWHLCSTLDAECVIGAASRDQASQLYRQAVNFVRRSPGLQERVVAKEGYREIRKRRDAGRIRVLAADVDTADGVIPTLALVDELHRHKSADLYGVFRDGLGPRGGQMITISTAGAHEQSPLGQMRAAARKLELARRGRYVHAVSADKSFALHEWSLEKGDDLDDIALVKQVNPASWQNLDELRQRHDSPSMLPWHWARFACGVWIGAEAWWVSAEDWHEATDPSAGFLDGDAITVGFDGSRFGDATALVGCRLEDGLLQLLGVWEAPPGSSHWEVPGGQVDATLARVMERYRVVRGYFDPPLWQSEIDGWAREYGDSVVLRYPTNRARMMDATERFRTDLVAQRIPHTGDPALTRHMLNAQIREARGGYWLTKNYEGSPDKIDAAVAAVLAYEARCDAVAGGELEPKRKAVISL
jgi:phage terminase large subunit-like protein